AVRLAVEVSPRARRQIEEINTWWRLNRSDAPELFERELSACFDVLSRVPGSGTVFKSKALRGTRRLLLRKSHYHVYYLIGSAELLVLAVWHAHRGAAPPLRG
ncbi:MAG TPA: type II toxin-antitoxin system RelE/ParE family toxin, partial [Alphaproteobacteria bacterium]|nr:type II toxin-antitoxin system RelE/ParE family toxin [Alphaproteobacteria bacterium]